MFINISEKVKYMMNNFDLTLEDVSKYLGLQHNLCVII